MFLVKFGLVLISISSLARAEWVVSQHGFANVEFDATIAGRPQRVYQLIRIMDIDCVRTEFGIYRIHRAQADGRRRGEALVTGKKGEIIEIAKTSTGLLKASTGNEKSFTIDVTVPDPLKTFRVER